MEHTLNPLDQLIAARVKVRFASMKLADVNDYGEAVREIKSADTLIGGLKTVSTRSASLSRDALREFSTKVDEIPGKLEALGVSTAGIKRFHTQLVNLIKVAQKGHPLRAYSVVLRDETPIGKAQSVLVSLGKAALKSSGAGSKILKPALIQNYLTKEIVPSLEAIREACANWFHAIDDDCSEISRVIFNAGGIHAEPHRSGFEPDPDYDKYAEAQREFANESRDLADVVRHNALGLPLASRSFEDCADVDLALNTMAKANDDLLKLHLEFSKKWGDYRAKLQGKFSPQQSLF